jgi:cysteine-rich repeat protein
MWKLFWKRYQVIPVWINLLFTSDNNIYLASAAQSTVSGSAISAFTALSAQTVTVTAKDSGGNSIGVGGDLFYVQISNEWTKTSNFEWTIVDGADNTIISTIFAEMTDNNDGTYSYTWIPDNEGKLSISVVKMNRFSVLGTYYNTVDLSGTAVSSNYSTNINYNWGGFDVIPGQGDYVSAKYEAYLKSPYTGTVTLNLYVDNYGALWVDGIQKFNYMTASWVWTRSTTVSMIKDQFYHIEAHFGEITGGAIVQMSYSYTGQPSTIIPTSQFYYPEYVSSSPYTVTVTCPTGYNGTHPIISNKWVEVWGDSKKVGSEKWDDGNTSNGDGCNSDCSAVETSWVWTGGSVSSRDICIEWTSGFYQNDATTPTLWVTLWGDGKKAGTEKCDDGNTINGDGCNGDCTSVETGWVCSGGSTTTTDAWTFCTAGFYQNDATTPTTCITQWGDGLRAGSEKCDDGNTSDGDGCKSDCTDVESSWVCDGGSTVNVDTCTFCTTGFYQNDAITPTTCVTQWGDGLEAGTEKWDDENTSNGDGCKSDCSGVEAGWVCSGGSTSSADTCTLCAAGYYQNDATNPTACVTIWGDGLEAGTEKWDDANTVGGDGCMADCSEVEDGWVCIGGSTTSVDAWSKWAAGWEQNDPSNPEIWVEICGDGLRVGKEAWDDKNLVNGDGCSSDWRDIEDNYIWVWVEKKGKDIWTTWDPGFKPNSKQSECIKENIQQTGHTIAVIYLWFTFVGIFFNTLTVLTSNYGYQSLFSMINQLQIILMMPLTGVWYPKVFYDFNRVVSFTFFSFSHITENVISKGFSFSNDWKSDQQYSYLKLIGIEYGSTLYNVTGLLFIIVLILIVHTIFYFINDMTLEKKSESSWMKFTHLIVNYLSFSIYLRMFMLCFLFLLCWSIPEIRRFKNSSDNFESYIFATLVLVLTFALTITITIIICKTPNETEVSQMKLAKEIFYVIKKNKLARSYWAVFLLRRLLFVLVVFSMYSVDSSIKHILFTSVQTFYLCYIVISRPFIRIKDNAGEILNEVFYLSFLWFSFYEFHNQDWEDTTSTVFMCTIVSNNIIFWCIAIGKKYILNYSWLLIGIIHSTSTKRNSF